MAAVGELVQSTTGQDENYAGLLTKLKELGVGGIGDDQ
jgi:hypothetical protein